MSMNLETPQRIRIAPTIALAVVSGLSIALIGIIPLLLIAPLNRGFHPEVPWAAIVTVVYLALLTWWLNGGGWPQARAAERKHHLRLWRPEPGAWRLHKAEIVGLSLAIAGMYAYWIAMSPAELRMTDFSEYPATAYRITLFVMGAVISGGVEEIAFRGYMQSRLERIGPAFAILVTSLVFTLIHITHGLAALLVLAPGLFIISLFYGLLAQRCGSILPGMALHILGDGARVFIVFLGGDASLLIAG